MKKLVFYMMIFILTVNVAFAKDSNKISKNQQKVELIVKNIPKGQRSLFIPIEIDSNVADIDKVELGDLASSNVLAVPSNSKGMSGPGVGLLKFDDQGLPATLKLNLLLTSVSNGMSDVSLFKVIDAPALPSKGLQIHKDVTVNVIGDEIEVTEKLVKDKKRLALNQHKATLEITRSARKAEKIFIPIVFDNKVVDVDETFGHTIWAPGISFKTYSSNTITHDAGSAIEIVLTEAAEKDFSVDIDLLPKGVGKTNLAFALPQSSHTGLVLGPTVEFYPTTVSVKK